jgi:DNA-directed RNA polymerase subunit beta
LINAEGDGVIEYVDANIITIKYDRSEEEWLVLILMRKHTI